MFGRKKKQTLPRILMFVNKQNGEWGLTVDIGGGNETRLRSITQDGAIFAARLIGQCVEYSDGSAELTIFGEDGKVHSKDSYGWDSPRIKG